MILHGLDLDKIRWHETWEGCIARRQQLAAISTGPSVARASLSDLGIITVRTTRARIGQEDLGGTSFYYMPWIQVFRVAWYEDGALHEDACTVTPEGWRTGRAPVDLHVVEIATEAQKADQRERRRREVELLKTFRGPMPTPEPPDDYAIVIRLETDGRAHVYLTRRGPKAEPLELRSNRWTR